jgi:hypothetical protein
VDLPELPGPLIRVPLELLLTAGVARLPVAFPEEAPLMDEAPYYAEAFSPITGRCFRLVSGQDGQAGHAGFCSRPPAEPARRAPTAQVSGVEIPGPTCVVATWR